MKRFMLNFNKRFITVLIAMTFSLALYSLDRNLLEEGNSHYSQGKFEEALETYLLIGEEGYVSDMLYYNIANSYFKLGNYGKAILYYERALTLNPSGKDIRNNLEHTKSFIVDNIEELPEFIVKTWLRDVNYMLTSNQWTYISLFLFACSALLLLVFRYGPSHIIRKSSFFVAVIFLMLAFSVTLFALNQKNAYTKDSAAIVMSAVSTIRSSPDSSGNTLFILHEGTKVILLERLGSWRRIELSDGRQGWIPEDDLEII